MKIIEKELKEASNNNRIRCGTKEVIRAIKGSDLIVITRSLNSSTRRTFEEQALSMGIKIYQYEGNSMQLGKFCGKPFRTSVVSIKAEQT
jgi:large subunit ribosomal protein L30e